MKLNCSFDLRAGELKPIIGRPSILLGIPHDRPVIGYGGANINTLRLWAAGTPDYFDFQQFSRGDFAGALAETLAAESLTRVLYPDDSTSMGQGLRFLQEYFLVACSLGDLVRRFRRTNSDWNALPEKIAIQMNDTHPAMAVPELMRILLDEAQMGWGDAWELTQRSLGYTNHTLLPEALEKWPLKWFDQIIPRNLEIIQEINRRFLETVRERFPDDAGRVARMSLFEENGAGRKVRMANLAIVGSHSTNGVAAIHSELLRTRVVRDFAEMFPERFNNKTNGVTPRRWLLLANPWLSTTIREAIGDGWISDLGELARLKPMAEESRASRAVCQGQARSQAVLHRMAREDPWCVGRSTVDLRLPGQAHSRIQAAVAQRPAHRRSLQPPAREPEPRVCAAHFLLRGQGRSGVPPGQTHHQADQQHRRHDRW